MQIPTLPFYTMTEINLALEDFHNAGLTPEETKKVIEGMYDPYGNSKFYCHASGINSNWFIKTFGPESGVAEIVMEIQFRLEDKLLEKRLEKETKCA